MLIYYVHVGNRFFKKEKLFFDCQCKVDAFIKERIENPIFADKAKEVEFNDSVAWVKKDAILGMCSVVRIDTDICKNWQKLFTGKLMFEL